MKNNYKQNTELLVENNNYLLEYLLSKLKHKSKNNIKSLLVRGNVFVDGKQVTKYNYELHAGQKVIVKLTQIIDKNYNEILDIIYEDNDIIVINKQAGLLSISTDKEKDKTAYHMVMDYVRRNNHGNRVFIVHRLDRETSGVLLFAKSEHMKRLLQDNWSDIVSIRGYIAIVEGKLEKDSGTVKSWLKETKTQMVYSSNKEGDGDLAITHYKKIKENKNYTMLDINIDTGRKNQIRVHMHDIGHSVVGDKKYYAHFDPIKRLGLHASLLELRHPVTNKIMRFEVSTPDEFLSLF